MSSLVKLNKINSHLFEVVINRPEKLNAMTKPMWIELGKIFKETSKKMAHLSLIPAINSSNENDFIVANGTSCRHQISDLSEKKGKHVSELLFKIFETVN